MIDGKLYGIPIVEDTYKSGMVMYLREDWLKRLGLEVPKTMAELTKVAEAFANNDPDGNGQKDTYGLAVNGADAFSYYGGISAVFEAFGTVPAYYDQRYTFIEKDGEIVWGGELSSEMKKGLSWLKDMYSKGGISSGFITKNKDNIIGDISMGKCGIFFGTPDMVSYVAVDTAKYNPAARIISAAVPDGNGSSKIYISNTPQYFNTVSSKCENPEGVIRLMNLSVQKLCNPSSKEEVQKYYGDGENYTGYQCSLTPMLPADRDYNTYLSLKGAVEKDSETALEQENIFYNENLQAYRMIKKYINAQKVGGIDWSDKNIASGLKGYTMIGGKNSSYSVVESLIKKNHFNLSAYNGVMTEKMTQNYTALYKLTNNAVVKIICADDIGAYDAFLESWKQQGGSEIIEEAKQWHDSNGL
jgi:putative aldouronate transport system substrate-binding protein